MFKGYTVDGAKKMLDATPEGVEMEPGSTFNGGVMLVTPHEGIFDIIVSDCTKEGSLWHMPTSYPESHYLKWITNWTALDGSLNFCPRMGKGQPNTSLWQSTRLDHVKIFHFSTSSKPYYWFRTGYVGCIAVRRGIEIIHPRFLSLAQSRADFAYQAWCLHLAWALILFAAKDGVLTKQQLWMCIAVKDRAFFAKIVAAAIVHFKATMV